MRLRETELLKVLPASHLHRFRSKERAQSLDRDNGDACWGTRPAGNYIMRLRWRCPFLCEEVIFQVLLSIKSFATFCFYCVLFCHESNTHVFCIPQPLLWTPLSQSSHLTIHLTTLPNRISTTMQENYLRTMFPRALL